jgi:hypothetical protein
MRTSVHRGAQALLVLALAVFGLTSSASAATVAIELCAVPGTAPLPGGGLVPIWGFGTPTTPGDCSTASAGLPGPQLTATAGDRVTITVRNALPAGHTVSFEIPGVAFNPGPTDAASGAAVSRTFTAQPGTYLYQSGGDAGRQEAMGLSGALLVRTTTPNQAYASATTAYDVESVLVMHPDVVEAAVVGVPDQLRGEVLEAFVVVREGVEGDDALEADLQQLVKKKFAAHAYPRTVHFVPHLPKTPSGKVQRYILRRQGVTP